MDGRNIQKKLWSNIWSLCLWNKQFEKISHLKPKIVQ